MAITMKSFLLLIFIIYLTNQKLEMVVEVFRHGHRGPFGKIWNYKAFEKYYLGELTEVGMRQHYILGAQMRQKYIEDQHFLDGYNQSTIYVRSTDVNRTIISAQSHLMGFFPEGTGPQLDQDYPFDKAIPPYRGISVNVSQLGRNALPNQFQPVPIHVFPSNGDYLLSTDQNCPILDDLNELYKKTEYAKILEKNFMNDIEKTAKMINYTKKIRLSRLIDFMDMFYADIYENKPLPNQMTPDLFKNLTLAQSLLWQLKYYSQQKQIKLLNSEFFENLIKTFDKKIQKQDELKFIIYSAHDTTISPISVGMNFTNIDCLMEKFMHGKTQQVNCEFGYPLYASQILIELHKNDEDGTYFIKVIYNGKEMNLCEKLDTSCNYEEFKQRLKNYIVKDLKKQCENLTIKQYFKNLNFKKLLQRK